MKNEDACVNAGMKCATHIKDEKVQTYLLVIASQLVGVAIQNIYNNFFLLDCFVAMTWG